MRKKLLAVALSSVMAMSLFACGGGEAGDDATTKAAATTTAKADQTTGTADDTTGTADSTDTTDATSGTTTVKPVVDTEEDLTKEPIFKEDFNGETSKIKVVYHENFNPDTGAPSVAGTMPTAEAAAAAGKVALYATGIDGTQCLSLDGTYGATLDYDWKDMESYTLSFWINPARYAQYSTMLTVGQDLLDTAGTVAWMNITKVKDWTGYDIAPVIWSRSKQASLEVTPDGAGDNVWPWYGEAYFTAAEGTQMTTKEWHHIVITVDGSKEGRDPVTEQSVPGTVQATTYIDGQLFGTGPLAKYTMVDASEVYLGINAWDVNQKADYDNIELYDYVLTGGQVFKIYNSQKGAN